MHLKRLLLKPLFACLLVMAVIGGCAYRSLIYNNLEWLILYQVDSYLDLSSVQKQQLKLPIHETLDWFKAERLPQLINMLKESRELAAKRAIDSVYFNKKLATLGAWRAEVTEKLIPPISLLLHNLDAEQMERLQKKIDKGNAALSKLLERSESEFPDELADYAADS